MKKQTHPVWTQVGALLQRERERRFWGRVDVTREGGPTINTVNAHEDGDIRTVVALDEHLKAFKWELHDVLSAALAEEAGRYAISPEWLAFARRCEGMEADEQKLLQMMASAMAPAGSVKRGQRAASPPALRASSAGTARSRAAHPRTAKSRKHGGA
jgi:hypothetical protein